MIPHFTRAGWNFRAALFLIQQVVEGPKEFTEFGLILLDLYLLAQLIHPVLFVGIHLAHPKATQLRSNCYCRDFRLSGSK